MQAPAHPPTTAILEREDETEALAALLARAAAGEGGALLVSGPAGIGKTALLELVRERAELPVLSARGSELDRDFAFGGVHQLFERVIAQRELRGAAVHARAAFALGGAPDQAILHGLYWLMVELGPRALVIDDAHWLDRPTLRFLAYLIDRVADLPVAVVLAARDELLERIATLALAPLSLQAVRRLAGEDAEAVYAATGGNPFYVHARLAPGDLGDAVALRLQSLPPACRALARALAVLDGAGSGTLAARLARLDVLGTVEAAQALRAAGILGADGFTHPLVRCAVYDAIPAAERAAAHAAAARVLAEAGAPPERVAAQILAGEPGGGAWDVAALRRAAAAAWARAAPETAARFLQRARAEDLPRAERIAVLRELAPAMMATSGPRGFPYLYEALGQAETPTERAEISLELARGLFTQGFFTEAASIYELALAERESPVLRERLATVAVLDLRLLRRLGGLAALADGGRTPIGTWIEVATRPGASAAEDASEPSGLVALMASGRLQEAERGWTGVADAARAAGALETLRLAVALRALARVRIGDVAAVEADVGELLAWTGELELPSGDARVLLPWAIAPLVDALVERGDLNEAQRRLTQSGLESEWPELLGVTFLLDALGRLRLAQGRVGEAVRALRECGRRQRAWVIRNPGFLPWRTSLAAALARTGRTGEALDLCDEQADLARAFGVAREEGMALRLLGELGDRDAATRAVEVLRASPARLEYARALVSVGESLHEALEIAVRCGATALARDALAASGAEPPPLLLLTAAELRVTRMAAEGLSNREIAETLFVTEKTVEGRLAAARRKL